MIRPISKARAARLKVYFKLRRAWLKKNPKCANCENMTTEIHHKMGRGALLNDVRYWVALCRACHAKVHSRPIWGRQMGLLGPVGSWGSREPT